MLEQFASEGIEFELRVRRAGDLETTPVENAARGWPAEAYPYRAAARVVTESQTAWLPEGDAYFAHLSFQPAHSLAAHWPLGQSMYARMFVYGRMAALRQRRDGETPSQLKVADAPA